MARIPQRVIWHERLEALGVDSPYEKTTWIIKGRKITVLLKPEERFYRWYSHQYRGGIHRVYGYTVHPDVNGKFYFFRIKDKGGTVSSGMTRAESVVAYNTRLGAHNRAIRLWTAEKLRRDKRKENRNATKQIEVTAAAV